MHVYTRMRVRAHTHTQVLLCRMGHSGALAPNHNKTGNVRISITLRCVHATSRHGKAKSITYSECMFVVLVIQHAMCTHCNVIGGLPSCTVFFHNIS